MTANYKAITNIPGWLSDFQSSGIPDSEAQLYATVPLIYRCVQLRADALHAVPIKITKIGGDQDAEVDWPFPEPLEKLIWRAEASLQLTGAAYWEIVRNAGRIIKDIKYRNPYDLSVKYAGGKYTFKQGKIEWENEPDLGKYEIVYFKEYDPVQDVQPGVGSARVAKVDAKLLSALSKFPEHYFEGGAMPVTLLGVDTTDTGEISRVEAWFQRSATAIRNAFRVLGIRAGSITATTLTPPLEQMAMPELTEAARKNIMTAFGVPESMIDTTASNFATAKESRLSFYEDTIMARAKMYENVINQQLLAPIGLHLMFGFEQMSIFQEDEDDRSTVLEKLRQSGVPLRLALDMAGYQLTDEQIALLEAELAQVEPAPKPESQPQPMPGQMPEKPDMMGEEMRRWERKAAKAVKAGKEANVPFESEVISLSLMAAIAGQLETAVTADDVKRIFAGALEWRGYP